MSWCTNYPQTHGLEHISCAYMHKLMTEQCVCRTPSAMHVSKLITYLQAFFDIHKMPPNT